MRNRSQVKVDEAAETIVPGVQNYTTQVEGLKDLVFTSMWQSEILVASLEIYTVVSRDIP